MTWQFDNNLPIYIQIMDRIKLEIISKKLDTGEKLPSVRDLAEQAGVNPNTIQRALSELEREGFVYSQRTTGRFVTDNHDLIYQSRQRLSQEELKRFIDNMTNFGYEKQDLPEVVTRYLEGEKHDTTKI